MRETKEERLLRMTAFDQAYCEDGRPLAGIDEVGRGPLAGPVVTGCVSIPKGVLGVNDSKKLTEKSRETLYALLVAAAVYRRTAWVPAEEIDKLGILAATRRAMNEAASELPGARFLVDAVDGLMLPGPVISILHGDALSYQIAAASIVAKVERNRYMIEMDARYPGYGFASNKGYGTAEHIQALQRLGPCPLHRQSFIGHFI